MFMFFLEMFLIWVINVLFNMCFFKKLIVLDDYDCDMGSMFVKKYCLVCKGSCVNLVVICFIELIVIEFWLL